jgi:NosL
MSASRQLWKVTLIALLAVSGLAVVGTSVRRGSRHGCALDGAPIITNLTVRLVDQAGQSHEFCCIRCAELWLQSRKETSAKIYVTDEVSGKEIESTTAYLVRSQVTTNAATRNRVHAFERKEDAERHANAYGGKILSADERPF